MHVTVVAIMLRWSCVGQCGSGHVTVVVYMSVWSSACNCASAHCGSDYISVVMSV